MYMRAVQPLGATEEMLAQMFQNTLTKVVLRWFFNMENNTLETWKTFARSSITSISTI